MQQLGARIGAVIGLSFALVWLGVGAAATSGATRIVVLLLGIAAIVFAGLRSWRRVPVGGHFDRRWYGLAVIVELAAMMATGALLDRLGLSDYAWQAIGIIVGLHFIGLWRAAGDSRFLWLSLGMTAVNIVALTLVPSLTARLLSGLGSSAAIVLAVAA